MNSNEEGRTGLRQYDGAVFEEFLPELRGRRGVQVYREMADNDDIVGAILFAITMLVKQAAWRVEPAGATQKDRDAAEFVESCMDDMETTWIDTISEILSFLTYGWSFHEIVYKRRMGRKRDLRKDSKYDDGLIGWRKIPIRGQETLYKWEFDDEENLIGMIQQPPPSYKTYEIPMSKAMLFRTQSRKDNPEGRSILRNAYRAWYFKRRIQEIEGIGIERDLAGLPVIYTPEDMDIWSDNDQDMIRYRSLLEKYIKGIRSDKTEGLILPAGFKLELVSSGGQRQFDTSAIINRYDTRIAMTVMADFIFLGHEATGSFALSSNKTEIFSTAIGAYLDIICEEFNRKAIPDLIDINGETFAGITDYPVLVHGDIEDVDIQSVADYIQKMTGVGLITPDDQLEDYIREAAHLPGRESDQYCDGNGRRRDVNRPKTAAGQQSEGETGDSDNDDGDVPDDVVDAAKRRLGRE